MNRQHDNNSNNKYGGVRQKRIKYIRIAGLWVRRGVAVEICNNKQN